MKIIPIFNGGEVVARAFTCPGCVHLHALWIRPHKNQNGTSWDWNGSENKPTFRPSIMSKVERADGKFSICHSYVTDGKIDFLSDSTHALSGQSADLLDVND